MFLGVVDAGSMRELTCGRHGLQLILRAGVRNLFGKWSDNSMEMQVRMDLLRKLGGPCAEAAALVLDAGLSAYLS